MAQALCLLFACLLFSCMADPRAGNGRLAALMTVGALMGMSKFTFTPLLLLGFLALTPYPNLQPYLPQQTLHGLKHHGIGNHRK